MKQEQHLKQALAKVYQQLEIVFREAETYKQEAVKVNCAIAG